MALKAFSSLDSETLLKIGSDLSTLCNLGLEFGDQGAIDLIQAILLRVGASDNDLVVFALQNKS